MEILLVIPMLIAMAIAAWYVERSEYKMRK